jgi:hypothetical protein|tara:strand:+ start:4442 stop:5002 length:561 start_codon:yes stop_codon:yes gene_type:complete
MGLLERIRQVEEPDETLEERTAHDALDLLEEKLSHISPYRVIFASLTALLVLSASLVAVVWLVPYDRVSVDVVYKQGGSSHIILAEINNQGSRSIESVSLDLIFIDSEGMEIQRTHFESDRISAHKSLAGDELEMIVNGESVWENYTIDIILTYDNYRKSVYEKNTMDVGDWTLELFTVRPPLQIL